MRASSAEAVSQTQAAPIARPLTLTGAQLSRAVVAILVFLSGFVMIEPTPGDLLLVLVIAVWSGFGLRLNRYFMPMTILLLLYLAGGFLSFTQIERDISQPFAYIATTTFLVASAIFYASVIAAAPERMLPVIRSAYTIAAVIVAAIGILAYFKAIPLADAFKLYGRAKGTFKDPNVFGPFLVLPATVLARHVLTNRFRKSWWQALLLLILLGGVFLSFSRAAWGMLVFALLVTAVLAFITERGSLIRLRLVAYFLCGVALAGSLLAAAVSVPAVRDLWVQRAQVLESYDAGNGGRFDRQQEGFFAIQERPLGFGPFQFGLTYGEDEHNMWLKGFTVYGWLGGFSYIILVLWTLFIATPLVFKPRTWQPFIQGTYATYLGQLLIHNVIDNDHWRHLFLIYGILWGAYAAERVLRRRSVRWQRAPNIASPLIAEVSLS